MIKKNLFWVELASTQNNLQNSKVNNNGGYKMKSASSHIIGTVS